MKRIGTWTFAVAFALILGCACLAGFSTGRASAAGYEIGTVNVAAGKPGYASSNGRAGAASATNAPTKVSNLTRATSQNNNYIVTKNPNEEYPDSLPWFVVDLGEEVTVGRLKLCWGSSDAAYNKYAAGFKIQYGSFDWPFAGVTSIPAEVAAETGFITEGAYTASAAGVQTVDFIQPVRARQIKIEVTELMPDTVYCAMYGIEVYTAAEIVADNDFDERGEAELFASKPVNVALKKTAYASSTTNSTTEIKVSNLTDGMIYDQNGVSLVNSNPADEHPYVYVDLGERKHINKAVLQWNTSADDEYAVSYSVEVSNTAAADSWKEVASVTGENGPLRKTLTFQTHKARYLRVYVKEKAGARCSFSELSVFETDFDAAAQPSRKVSVLFVGNSHTYTHDVPQMISNMLMAENVELSFDARLVGGETLNGHYNNGNGAAVKKIQTHDYDFVVLQENASNYTTSGYLSGVRAFEKVIEDNNALKGIDTKVLLYMGWSNQNKPQMQEDIFSGAKRMCMETGYRIAPSGDVWEYYRGNPDYAFYSADQNHAVPIGAYASAATLFYTFMDELGLLPAAPLPASAGDTVVSQYGLDSKKCSEIHRTAYDKTVFYRAVKDYAESGFGVDASAVRTELPYGVNYDLAPLIVRAALTTADGGQTDAIKLYDDEYTVDDGGFDAAKAGEYTVTVSYKSYPSVQFRLTVQERQPKEIGFTVDNSALPERIFAGGAIDFSALIVKAVYDIGEDTVLSADDYRVILGSFDAAVTGVYQIRVTYKTYPAFTFSIEVVPAPPEEIGYRVDRGGVPASLEYGSPLDLSAIKVFSLYDDSNEYLLNAEAYSVDTGGFDANTAGTYTVTVRYKTYEPFSFTVTVEALVLRVTGFTVDSSAVEKMIEFGQTPNFSGLVVRGLYQTGDTFEIPKSDYTVYAAGLDGKTAGVFAVIVLYGTFSPVSFTVEVQPPTLPEPKLVGIAADYGALPKTYVAGAGLSPSDIVVKALYDDGSERILAKGEYTLELGGYDGSNSGEYSLTVSCGDFMADTFAYRVIPASEGIDASPLPKPSVAAKESGAASVVLIVVGVLVMTGAALYRLFASGVIAKSGILRGKK